ncbi:divalent-cation tolerance protein CutA, partial [Sphaerothrix gracilis]|uniref:divalent-cation tolerance protein CutA n=1 Tax=Sphaerothrix gracilis TaxID=3151835 RepID=UPI0031FD82F8
MTQLGVVLVTASSETEASAIASALVQERLAACVSLVPIQSVYRWQGEVQQETEWQLMIKSDLAQFTALAERVQQLHSYEVPEIIA